MRYSIVVYLVLMISPAGAIAQTYESITERAALAAGLHAALEREPVIFDAHVMPLPQGAAVISFLQSPTASTVPSLSALKAAAKAIEDVITAGFDRQDVFGGLLAGGAANAASGGALPPSALAVQAAAEFLAGRVKDELAIEYVDKLQELVARPIVSDITFHSRQALSLVQTSNYRLVLPLLRESVIRDLRALPDRLTTDSTYDGSTAQPTAASLTQAALAVRLVEGVLESRPALDLLAELRYLRDYVAGHRITKDSLVLADEGTRNALIVAGIMAHEFKLQSTAITDVVTTPDGARFFAIVLGSELLSDRYPGLTDQSTLVAELSRHEDLLRRAAATWEELDRLLDHVEDEIQLEALIGGYLAIVPRLSAALMAQAHLTGLQVSPGLIQSVRFMEQASAAYTAWLERRYVGVAVAAVAFADELNPNVMSDDVRKFLLFAANFADAESSDEMSAVMEAAALPPAGYRTKRQTAAVGISAYGGAAVFSEELDEGSTAAAGGLSFPIGVEFSFPWRPSVPLWSSVSVFVSLLDVGNFVNFRSANGPPEPSLDQALAPGIGLQFGAGRENPWSYGILYQHVPNLREDAELDVSRVGFFLGIDMPLFRLWSR